MARSVSRHPSAVEVVYLHGIKFGSDLVYPEDFDFGSEEHPPFDYFDFSEFLNELKEVLHKSYSSFRHCDRWIGREDRVILENGEDAGSLTDQGQ